MMAMNKEPKDTRNVLLQRSESNYFSMNISELSPKLKAFRVQFLILNLNSPSTSIPIGPGMPSSIIVYSNEFSSLTNNNYSFVNGVRRNVIACYPLHLGDAATVGGRTTWKFNIRQEWTRISNPSNVNRYDFFVGFDTGSQFNMSAGEFYSICLELENGMQ